METSSKKRQKCAHAPKCCMHHVCTHTNPYGEWQHSRSESCCLTLARQENGAAQHAWGVARELCSIESSPGASGCTARFWMGIRFNTLLGSYACAH